MGIEVEAGGTALSQTFNNIATGIGTGSDEIKAFTKTLGISAAEFKRRWTTDALGTFQAFLVELSKLDQYEQADILTKAGITGVRQLNAVKLMTQNIGFLSEQLDVASTAQGALDRESGKFFATTAGQWQVLKNNVRDAAATIGTELLPVTNELIKDFVGELNKPGTQAGIKAFAQDLAAGVRGLVGELRGTDFSGIIGGLKIAAEVAKGAFNAFRALPEPIQQLAIAALVANKVSGGAIGMIAKGLGNLVLGSLKTITAANVTVIGGNVTGGGGVAGAAGKGATILGGITKFLGLTTAVGLGAILGSEIGKNVFFNPTVKPAVDFETGVIEEIMRQNDPAKLTAAIENIDGALQQLGYGQDAVQDALVGFLYGDQIKILRDQKAALQALLAEARSATPRLVSEFARSRATSAQLATLARMDAITLRTQQVRMLERLAPLPGGIAALVAKRWNINLSTVVNARLAVNSALSTMAITNSIRYDGKMIPL